MADEPDQLVFIHTAGATYLAEGTPTTIYDRLMRREEVVCFPVPDTAVPETGGDTTNPDAAHLPAPHGQRAVRVGDGFTLSYGEAVVGDTPDRYVRVSSHRTS